MSPRILQYYNVYRSQRIRPHVFLLSISFICGLSGCFSPLALDHIAIAYNESVSDVLSKQLLLNIARSRFNQPIFFLRYFEYCRNPKFSSHCRRYPSINRK